MAINVVTGGPVEEGSIGWTRPCTISQLSTVISDEIDDTQMEYVLQIRRAIDEAIKYCERENFYFNETRELTFTTVEDQQWYGAYTESYRDPDTGRYEDLSFFNNIIRITSAFTTYGPYPNGIKRRLSWSRPDELEYFTDNAAARGIPDTFAYFDMKIRLYPIPRGGPFTVRLLVEPVRLPEIKDEDAVNPWIVHGCAMIKARAKYNLYKNILKDMDLASVSLNTFEDELQALRVETSKRISNSNWSNVEPTRF